MSNDSTIVITNIHEALKEIDDQATENPACLVLLGGELSGTVYDLSKEITTVGRSIDNNISVDFRGISRKHFQIEMALKENQVLISDLGSSNGTFVNNKKITAPTQLTKGDTIQIGNIAFKYIPKGDPERLAYDDLQHKANTDGLTGCYNKTYFNDALAAHFRKSQTSIVKLSLILFDLDHFKSLNDTYGHDAGDYVLKEMANVIKKHGVRDKDIFARYGGEEFVIILPETALEAALDIAERLRQLIENHQFIYEQKRLPVTASIGVANFHPNIANSTELFKRADAAVYDAKNAGRNQVKFFK